VNMGHRKAISIYFEIALWPRMAGILKLHGYREVVDRATQEAKAEEQILGVGVA